MPCDSSHLNARGDEIEMSRVFLLLDEVNGGSPPDTRSSAWSGYDSRAYGKSIPSAVQDNLVADLCGKCRALGPAIRTKSLELQVWWRDHQRADAEREAADRRPVIKLPRLRDGGLIKFLIEKQGYRVVDE